MECVGLGGEVLTILHLFRTFTGSFRTLSTLSNLLWPTARSLARLRLDSSWYYNHRFTTETDPAHLAGVKAAAATRLVDLFKIVEKEAFKGGPYVLGAEMSACDYHVLMTTEWLGWTGMRDDVLKECPNLTKLRELMHADETVKKVWKMHGFIKE